MTLQERFENVKHFNGNIVYHWRNNRDRTMSVEYFIGYNAGNGNQVFRYKSTTQPDLLTPAQQDAMVEAFTTHVEEENNESN